MNDASTADRPRAKSLWPFIRVYRYTLAAAVTAMPVALPILIDNGFIARDPGTVNRCIGWFLLATIAFSLFATDTCLNSEKHRQWFLSAHPVLLLIEVSQIHSRKLTCRT